jgi:hypothetical protein
VSPTAPTFGTLNDQLTKAHRRIRELEARETELLAHNRTLCAVIAEITDGDASGTAMTNRSIRRCSTATKASPAVVEQRQASHANSYHHGV